MTALDPELDLAAVADGLEAITLRRPGRAAVDSVTHALRRRVTTQEAAASGGQVLASDVRWHLPISELAGRPRLGDQIVDAAGERWTILELQLATLGSRYQCLCRNLQIAAGLDALVTIEQAATVKSDSGAAEPKWIERYVGIPARIQRVSEEIQTHNGRQEMLARYRITVGEPVEVDATCRVIDSTGGVYQLTGVENQGRIDELPVLLAERIEPAHPCHAGEST